MSLSKVRAWQYYLWHICALFCCVEASLVSVWSGQTCKETLRCIQCPPTEMVSSLIILVSLRGNCSGKKESLADQFGLHCSITQIRGNRPELGGLSVISSSSSLHWYILCSLNMPALTQTIIITTYCCKMVVSSRDLTRRLANIIEVNCNKRKEGLLLEPWNHYAGKIELKFMFSKSSLQMLHRLLLKLWRNQGLFEFCSKS